MGGASLVVGGGTGLSVVLDPDAKELDDDMEGITLALREAAGTATGANILADFLAFFVAPGTPTPAHQ
jgi:hypothetical protein